MKILIVDNQPEFREKLLLLCQAEPKLESVAVASDCQEAMTIATLLAPDLMFIDEQLLDDCSLEPALDTIKAANPYIKIIFLSETPTEKNMLRAYRHGSIGYLAKGSDAFNLFPAILELKAGEFVLSPRLSYMAVASLHGFQDAVGACEVNRLTSREKEVVHQLCAGFSNREIAQNLVISENTVRIHIQNLLKKLNLQNRRQVQEKFGLLDGMVYSMIYASPQSLEALGKQVDLRRPE